MKQYLVWSKYDDDSTSVSLQSSVRIIDTIDCLDFLPIVDMKVYDVTDTGDLVPLVVHGCWHKHRDPLYIAVTREDGSVVFDGYGTDH